MPRPYDVPVEFQIRRRGADLVDIAGVAERLGVKRETVNMWRYRELLPEPLWMLNGGPVWEWVTIQRWAIETGRMP